MQKLVKIVHRSASKTTSAYWKFGNDFRQLSGRSNGSGQIDPTKLLVSLVQSELLATEPGLSEALVAQLSSNDKKMDQIFKEAAKQPNQLEKISKFIDSLSDRTTLPAFKVTAKFVNFQPVSKQKTVQTRVLSKKIMEFLNGNCLEEVARHSSDLLKLYHLFLETDNLIVAEAIRNYCLANAKQLAGLLSCHGYLDLLEILIDQDFEEENELVRLLTLLTVANLRNLNFDSFERAYNLLEEKGLNEEGTLNDVFHQMIRERITLDHPDPHQLSRLIFLAAQVATEDTWEFIAPMVLNLLPLFERDDLARIIFAFGRQRRGSDEFWSKIDRTLNGCTPDSFSRPQSLVWMVFGFKLAGYNPRNFKLTVFEDAVYSNKFLAGLTLPELSELILCQHIDQTREEARVEMTAKELTRRKGENYAREFFEELEEAMTEEEERLEAN